MTYTALIVRTVLLAGALAVSGCVSTTSTTMATRDIGLTAPPTPTASTSVAPASQSWSLGALVIDVPRSLEVSEGNSLKPRADIVWREDPMGGDRHAQVEAVMRAALEPAISTMAGETPVQVNLQVTRFHALTERARYTTGGQHEIEFIVTVRDAETGAVLMPSRPVDLTFRAYGGSQAIEQEAQGITQRVRITQRLQEWALSTFPGAGTVAVSPAI